MTNPLARLTVRTRLNLILLAFLIPVAMLVSALDTQFAQREVQAQLAQRAAQYETALLDLMTDVSGYQVTVLRKAAGEAQAGEDMAAAATAVDKRIEEIRALDQARGNATFEPPFEADEVAQKWDEIKTAPAYGSGAYHRFYQYASSLIRQVGSDNLFPAARGGDYYLMQLVTSSAPAMLQATATMKAKLYMELHNHGGEIPGSVLPQVNEAAALQAQAFARLQEAAMEAARRTDNKVQLAIAPKLVGFETSGKLLAAALTAAGKGDTIPASAFLDVATQFHRDAADLAEAASVALEQATAEQAQYLTDTRHRQMRQNEILVLLAVVIFLLAARSIVRDRIVVSAQPLSTVTLSSAPTVAPGAKLDVDVRIRSSVMDITNAAALVRGNAERLGLLVKEAKQRSGAMHTAAGEAEDVTNKAAAAAEELSAAIGTIRTQVEKSGAVADRASDQAETLDRSIHTLAEASGRIDAAVATIGAIASRINLLALNATIESARAGDAGKGFAAIAAEVKDLAGHTANAREDILSQAQAMQQVTQQAAKSVSDLVAILGEINAATTIATTTAQAQQTATQAISRTLGDAATGTAKLSQSTRRIAQDTEESGASSKELLNSATALQQKVEAFLQTVRRA